MLFLSRMGYPTHKCPPFSQYLLKYHLLSFPTIKTQTTQNNHQMSSPSPHPQSTLNNKSSQNPKTPARTSTSLNSQPINANLSPRSLSLRRQVAAMQKLGSRSVMSQTVSRLIFGMHFRSFFVRFFIVKGRGFLFCSLKIGRLPRLWRSGWGDGSERVLRMDSVAEWRNLAVSAVPASRQTLNPAARDLAINQANSGDTLLPFFPLASENSRSMITLLHRLFLALRQLARYSSSSNPQTLNLNTTQSKTLPSSIHKHEPSSNSPSPTLRPSSLASILLSWSSHFSEPFEFSKMDSCDGFIGLLFGFRLRFYLWKIIMRLGQAWFGVLAVCCTSSRQSFALVVKVIVSGSFGSIFMQPDFCRCFVVLSQLRILSSFQLYNWLFISPRLILALAAFVLATLEIAFNIL